jgi:hypothetical protein
MLHPNYQFPFFSLNQLAYICGQFKVHLYFKYEELEHIIFGFMCDVGLQRNITKKAGQ